MLAIAGGIALDIGLRAGVANGFVTVGLIATVALVLTRPALSPEARWMALAAIIPAVSLSIWSSGWLAGINLVAVGGLLAAATAFSRTGSLLDTTLGALIWRLFHALRHGLSRMIPFGRMVPRPRSAAVRAAQRSARAVLIALPLLLVLVALLAAADVVFANLVAPRIDVVPAVGHVGLTVMLATMLVIGGLSVGAEPNEREHTGRFGASEIAVVLGLAAAVLGLFVVSQLVALTGAGQRLVQEAGLTPAEYARSGFFQLCWAAVVVASYLALARYLAAPDALASRVVRALSTAVPTLALGLVVVSLRRMLLYDRAFGLTMLRLAVVAATIWIGTLLVMIAARNLGVGARRNWIPAATIIVAFSFVVVADVANPGAFVVHHNLARASQGADVDTVYLAELSDDAIPAIASALDRIDDSQLREGLQLALRCGQHQAGASALNLAAARAARMRAEQCGPA